MTSRLFSVWQKLEEENQEFFRAYHLRLIVKDQISRFNELLERHAKLIHQICPAGVNPIPLANGGSQMPPCKEPLLSFIFCFHRDNLIILMYSPLSNLFFNNSHFHIDSA